MRTPIPKEWLDKQISPTDDGLVKSIHFLGTWMNKEYLHELDEMSLYQMIQLLTKYKELKFPK